MSVPALQAIGVAKRFGGFTALSGVDLSVRRGTLHAIIGPNGAGKTTFFNVLTGQLSPSAGSVLIDGKPVHDAPVHRRVDFGLARSFQVTSLFGELTVLENLRLAAQGRNPKQALNFLARIAPRGEPMLRAEEILERVGLARVAKRKATELSHGQQRLLEVGMSLAPRPAILLLDEPTSGMGVDDTPVMEQLLIELTGDYTIVMIEHNMAMTMRVADRIAVMLGGSILLDSSPELVRNDERVRRAYLGQGLHA